MNQKYFFKWCILSLLLVVMSCSGGTGSGCSSCATACGGDPNYQFQGAPVDKTMKVRITEEGMKFITSNLKPLIEGVLGQSGQQLDCSGGGISVPDQLIGNGPQSGGTYSKPSSSNCITEASAGIPLVKVSCSGSTPSTTWYYANLRGNNLCGSIDKNSLSIQLDEPNNQLIVQFKFPELQIKSTNPDIATCVKQKVSTLLAGGTGCGSVSLALKDARIVVKDLEGKIKLQFYHEPSTGRVGLKVAPNGISFDTQTKVEIKVSKCTNSQITIFRIPIVNQDIEINLGSGFCSSILNVMTGTFNGLSFLQPALFAVLGPILSSQINKLNLLADAKVQMEVPIRNAIAGLGLKASPAAGSMGVLLDPSSSAGIVRKGLDLLFRSGFEIPKKSACVPTLSAPSGKPSPEPTMLGSYHLGASLSQFMLDHAFWSAHQAGALCLKFTTEQFSTGDFQLTAGLFAILAPDLQKIVPGDAPVFIQLEPQDAPTVTFGSGQMVNGKIDSLIQIQIKELAISFYALLHDRYVRLFRMKLDLGAGVTLTPLPTNELEVTVDASSLKLENGKLDKDHLVSTMDVSKIIPTISSLVVGVLSKSPIKIPVDISKQLSSALGIPITVTINGLKKDAVGGDWLTLMLTLSKGSVPLLPQPTTHLVWKKEQSLVQFKDSVPQATGRMVLGVANQWQNMLLEYQYKINQGTWSPFLLPKNGELSLQDPRFKLLGKHRLWVRARIQGEYRSLEETPAVLSYHFDPLPPTVSMKKVNETLLELQGSDQVTATSQLKWEVLENNRWKTMNSLFFPLQKQHRSLRFRVTDEAGNYSTLIWHRDFPTEVIQTPKEDGLGKETSLAWGCSSSEMSNPPLFWLFFLGLFWFWKRSTK